MTDEEKIEAVTAKLTGGFHVGQRVRIIYPYWTGKKDGFIAEADHLTKRFLVMTNDKDRHYNSYFDAEDLEPRL